MKQMFLGSGLSKLEVEVDRQESSEKDMQDANMNSDQDNEREENEIEENETEQSKACDKMETDEDEVTEERKTTEILFKQIDDCVKELFCEDGNTDMCEIGKCKDSGDSTKLEKKLEEIFTENCIEVIQYKKWIQTDRSNLEIVKTSTDKFIRDFTFLLKKYDL